MRTVSIVSSRDGTEQKALFYAPPEAAPAPGSTPVPLLVALHTWGGDYQQLAEAPKDRRWAMITPDFRGPNIRPEACASPLAIQDVLDAVAFAQTQARIDEARIYLVGQSGGGHMALMMAAQAPALWAGVSSWVPISDLLAWRRFHMAGVYCRNMDSVCGGAPGTVVADKEYYARSPIHILPAAKGVALDINAGIHDGHVGSVPISHSLNAFNVLAEANGFKARRIAESDIEFMTREQAVAPGLISETQPDGERAMAVLFRRVAGPVRITLFEGNHQWEVNASLNWLSRQQKGAPACFDVPSVVGAQSKEGSAARQVGL